MDKCISIPGILNVWYVDTSYLPDDVIFKGVAGIHFSLGVQPISIPFIGEAVCEVDEQDDNNSQIQKVTLTFYTLRLLPTERDIAFVIRTIDDQLYLIGAKERPFPTVRMSATTGKTDGDAAIMKYEVNFSARKALIPCEP